MKGLKRKGVRKKNVLRKMKIYWKIRPRTHSRDREEEREKRRMLGVLGNREREC